MPPNLSLPVLNEPAALPLQKAPREPKPSWLKVRAPGGENYARLKQTLRKLDLYTVCEEARCPNVGECWSAGTATVMLLGHTCTRGCRFCAVTTGNPRGVVDPREPEHVAKAISNIGLKYVVLTMVDRDDILDGGASHMGRAVTALRQHQPDFLVETLVGDFGGRKLDIQAMIEAAPDVFAHNIEVSRRLTPKIRDQRCGYDRSLEVLRYAKELAPTRLTKSSIMVGIGETDEEVYETLKDLREARVDVVTLGQYLRPTPKHAPVDRYVTPEQFAEYERVGKEVGFLFVASGPLVRSSYHAAEGFIAARLAASQPGGATAKAPPASRPLPSVGTTAQGLTSGPNGSSAKSATYSGLLPAASLIRRGR